MMLVKEKDAMFASVKDLQEYTGLSAQTIRTYIHDIEQLKSRYRYSVAHERKYLRVNLLSFVDYITNRREIQEGVAPPFNAKAVREALGLQLERGMI